MQSSSDEKVYHLEQAIESLPDAIAVFDDEGRFVFWNARFAAIYGEGIEIQTGTRFEDHLRWSVERGLVPAAKGREEAWLAERLQRFALGADFHEHRLGNGRWVRVQDRLLPGGGRVGIRSDVTDLVEREQSFRMLYDVNPTPMYVVDRETLAFLSVNDAALALYGYTRDEMLKLKLADIRPETMPGEIAGVLARMGHEPVRGLPATHRTATGEERFVKVNLRLFDYEGRPALLAAIFDMTEQHRMEQEVRRMRAFLEQVVDHVPTAVFVKDVDDGGRYVVFNRASEAMFGAERSQVIGRTPAEVFNTDFAAKIAAQDAIVRQHGAFEADEDEVLRQANGATRLIRTRKVALTDTANRHFTIGVAEDVTDQRASAARIAHLAHHDLLTDLPNRALFNDRLTSALARLRDEQQGLALLYLDLDGFKAVNDRWGHATGDALLQAVSGRLRAVMHMDDTAARLGGDEFALIQATVRHSRDAETLAGRLVEAIARPFAIEGRTLQVGVSIGVALAPRHGVEPQALLSHADAALYRAKREGRRTYRLAA